MLKKALYVLATGSFMVSAAALAADLGTIDGKPITEKEFKAAIEKLGPQSSMVKSNPQIRQQFFDHYVNTQALVNAAEKSGIDKSPGFKDRMNEVRREVLARYYVEHATEERTNDKAMKDYFEKNKTSFGGKEVKASHILIKDEKAAQQALDAVKKGGDFAALAKEKSEDPGSKNNGGDLGFFKHGQMVPEFEQAAFSTPKGQLVPNLVKTQFGYHIIKVTDVKGDDKADFTKVKDQVAERMKREMQESLVKEARAKANVKVNDDALKNMKM